MNNFVVFEIVTQSERNGIRTAGHVNSRAFNSAEMRVRELVNQLGKRNRMFGKSDGKKLSALNPRQHQQKNTAGNDDRNPAAVKDLQRVGTEKRNIYENERTYDGSTQCHRPLPNRSRDKKGKNCRDQHGQ